VRLHRDGLESLLRGVPVVNVVGSVDLSDGLRSVSRLPVDALLVDGLSPDNLKLIRPLLSLRRRLRVIAVGIREEESEVLACAAAGVDGYVPLDASADDLVRVLDSVKRRELVCSPRVAASLYNCAALLASVSTEPLTLRELEVISLMNAGHSNKEIARRLSIEASTAKNHVQNILQKLNVHRRGQAAAKLRVLIRERLEPRRSRSSLQAISVGEP
jgi:DNA-binding NarL/FixJ family response regulator